MWGGLRGLSNCVWNKTSFSHLNCEAIAINFYLDLTQVFIVVFESRNCCQNLIVDNQAWVASLSDEKLPIVFSRESVLLMMSFLQFMFANIWLVSLATFLHSRAQQIRHQGRGFCDSLITILFWAMANIYQLAFYQPWEQALSFIFSSLLLNNNI